MTATTWRARALALLAALGTLGCGAPPPARLRVEVTPAEGRIFVEGEYHGTGRAELADLAPGPYHLRIDPPVGYQRRLHEVQLEPGADELVRLELARLEAVRSEAAAEARAAAAARAQAEADLPRVRLVTSRGDIELVLYEDDAPNTVANFVALAQRGFYDGITFHRVVANFMIQTGDPLSRDMDLSNDGKGGAGYAFPDEPNSRRHGQPGVLSMANSGPDTNSSQFFITVAATPWLDGRHTVFGRVAAGLDVVQDISKVLTDANDRPHDSVRLERVDILHLRDREYHPVDARGIKLPLPPDRRRSPGKVGDAEAALSRVLAGQAAGPAAPTTGP